MRSFDWGKDAAARSNVDTENPSACPACQSASIMTNAKRPDANSYWRCESCGEVWNVARRHSVVRRGAGLWR